MKILFVFFFLSFVINSLHSNYFLYNNVTYRINNNRIEKIQSNEYVRAISDDNRFRLNVIDEPNLKKIYINDSFVKEISVITGELDIFYDKYNDSFIISYNRNILIICIDRENEIHRIEFKETFDWQIRSIATETEVLFIAFNDGIYRIDLSSGDIMDRLDISKISKIRYPTDIFVINNIIVVVKDNTISSLNYKNDIISEKKITGTINFVSYYKNNIFILSGNSVEHLIVENGRLSRLTNYSLDNEANYKYLFVNNNRLYVIADGSIYKEINIDSRDNTIWISKVSIEPPFIFPQMKTIKLEIYITKNDNCHYENLILALNKPSNHIGNVNLVNDENGYSFEIATSDIEEKRKNKISLYSAAGEKLDETKLIFNFRKKNYLNSEYELSNKIFKIDVYNNSIYDYNDLKLIIELSNGFKEKSIKRINKNDKFTYKFELPNSEINEINLKIQGYNHIMLEENYKFDYSFTFSNIILFSNISKVKGEWEKIDLAKHARIMYKVQDFIDEIESLSDQKLSKIDLVMLLEQNDTASELFSKLITLDLSLFRTITVFKYYEDELWIDKNDFLITFVFDYGHVMKINSIKSSLVLTEKKLTKEYFCRILYDHISSFSEKKTKNFLNYSNLRQVKLNYYKNNQLFEPNIKLNIN